MAEKRLMPMASFDPKATVASVGYSALHRIPVTRCAGQLARRDSKATHTAGCGFGPGAHCGYAMSSILTVSHCG
jgi:hypothetical protein